MTGGLVETDAQWALHGKNADSEGYDVLACSTGALSAANFADAISRFALGAVDTLPQVSVSYARLGDQPGEGYLAMAIDDFAADGQRPAHDRNGRQITYTSYFCLPYRPLAEQAVGYLSTYEALRAVTLPQAGGPPLPVALAARAGRVLPVDPLAMRVAALLLTGRPVCVLGADMTSTGERLRFIDSAMDLLPYGLRARMAAATWTRATHGGHRFRLFFSSAPRPGGQQDHMVTWGEPDRAAIPEGPPADYLSWLEDGVGPLARLAGVTTEIGFGPKTGPQVLDLAVASGAGPTPVRARRSGSDAAPASDAGDEALRAVAEHMKLADLARLRLDIAVLNKLAEDEIGDDRRKRYQGVIARLGLLRHHDLVDPGHAERLYDALLPMAFGTPLRYNAYCRVEECAGITPGQAPHRGLLTAIVRAGTAGQAVSAIVCWHLRQTDEEKVSRWLVSGQVDAVELIGSLAGEWTDPRHARIVCDVTLEYLAKARQNYQPRQIRHALREHGFLARALQSRFPGDDQYQVRALYQFVQAAYADGPGRQAIVALLAGAAHPPTPALLAAVVLLSAKTEDVRLACAAYAYGSLTLINVDSALSGRLNSLVPDIIRASLPGRVDSPEESEPASAGD